MVNNVLQWHVCTYNILFSYITGSSSGSDDSDSDNTPAVKKPAKNNKISKPTNKKASKPKRVELTANEIARLMVQAVDNGKLHYLLPDAWFIGNKFRRFN